MRRRSTTTEAPVREYTRITTEFEACDNNARKIEIAERVTEIVRANSTEKQQWVVPSNIVSFIGG